MDWLIDRRGKSVASSAQRVVKDLHKDLDDQRSRVRELERALVQLQEVATMSLKDELFRLEMRRKELLLELEETDDAILDRREKLRSTEASIKKVIESESIVNSLSATATRGDGNRANINESFDSTEGGKSSQEIRGAALEEEFLEETEMLRGIKESLKEQVLFVIHSNNVDDVIVYFPSSSNVEIISSAKLEEHDEIGVVLTPTGNLDAMMNYGPQIVPNHERDFPHVQELVAPLCMRSDVSNFKPLVVNRRGSTGRVPMSEDDKNTGQLLGAVKLPLIPDVIIDIWRLPTGQCWATTSVDGTSFGVIERIFVTSETTYSVSVVVSVDVYGRHAAKNYLLAEKITS